MENFLATRFFTSYYEKPGVDKENAKKIFNEDYNIWESRYVADIYWENIDKIDIRGLKLQENMGGNK